MEFSEGWGYVSQAVFFLVIGAIGFLGFNSLFNRDTTYSRLLIIVSAVIGLILAAIIFWWGGIGDTSVLQNLSLTSFDGLESLFGSVVIFVILFIWATFVVTIPFSLIYNGYIWIKKGY